MESLIKQAGKMYLTFLVAPQCCSIAVERTLRIRLCDEKEQKYSSMYDRIRESKNSKREKQADLLKDSEWTEE